MHIFFSILLISLSTAPFLIHTPLSNVTYYLECSPIFPQHCTCFFLLPFPSTSHSRHPWSSPPCPLLLWPTSAFPFSVPIQPAITLSLPSPPLLSPQTLSPNGVSEAAVSVECLANDTDLSVILTKGTTIPPITVPCNAFPCPALPYLTLHCLLCFPSFYCETSSTSNAV